VNLIIRQARDEDAAALAAIYAPHVVSTPASFEEIAPGPAEMGRRVRNILADYPYLVAEEAGSVIGYAYASRHAERASYRWSVTVSVYIAPTHQRRGVGRTLYQTLFPLLAGQGLVVALAGVTLPNPASVALHESLGFQPVGIFKNVGYKFAAWRDVGWWQRPLIEPIPAHPAEPRPWAEMPALLPVSMVLP